MAASLGYLLDETDPSLTQGVLFEIRLELSEPDVIFVPPLDKNLVGNFYDQINGYLDDIFFGCSLIPRVAKHLDKGYETDKAKDKKISLIFFFQYLWLIQVNDFQRFISVHHFIETFDSFLKNIRTIV